MPHSHTALRPTHGKARKNTRNTYRHIASRRELNQISSSPFPSEVNTKLERTLNTTEQNEDQTQTPQTMGATTNNESTNNRATAIQRATAKTTVAPQSNLMAKYVSLSLFCQKQSCLALLCTITEKQSNQLAYCDKKENSKTARANQNV